MSKKEQIKAEIKKLYDEGLECLKYLTNKNYLEFLEYYQMWYTKSLKIVETLASDRYQEFRQYYEIDPKRKHFSHGTYAIQDFIKGITPSTIRDFDSVGRTMICFKNQLYILNSIYNRVDSVLFDIKGELYSELQDNEINIAKKLIKISPRAAGALMGVLIESHLQRVAINHNIKINKKNPTISDLNEPLKINGITDIVAWRKISYLSDLRNLCSHKKDIEPTQEQIEDLISGVEWLTKNVL
ncbi:MAG: hypothetical protein BGO41_09360 [Clostridiales bacterium 38-18]|nr:MAG: hypothetical protein BGO41_09360 [Clostridiales bacterium 38-18]